MWRRKPVKAILFDIGGVIAHAELRSGFFQVGSLLYGCTESDLAPLATEFVAQLERGEINSETMWQRLGQSLLQRGIGRAPEIEKANELWTLLLKESLQIDKGMLELCYQLQAQIPVGALSNTISEHAAVFEARGAYAPFNPCVLSFEVGMRKPESRIYQFTADLMNVPPENCLLIDDCTANIVAAKQAKMQTHLFTNRAALERDLGKLGLMSGS